MTVRLSLLGTPVMEHDGHPVAFETHAAVALVAYLAVTARPHRPETVAALLWPRLDRDEAAAALRRTLADIRRATGADAVRDDEGRLALDPAAVIVDTHRVREVLAGVRAHDHPATAVCTACAAALAQVADLHRGAFLSGYALHDSPGFDRWRSCAVEEARRELADVLSRLVDAHVLAGDLEPATRAARRRLELDPLHEPTHRALIRLHAWQGRRAAALAQYRVCVRVLRSELGVDPLDETVRLSEEVLAGQVVPPAGTRAGGSPPAADRAQRSPAPSVGPAVARRWRPPLVARERELAMLSTAIERTHTDGVVVVIEGEAGSGRTRLLEELLRRPDAGGRRMLSTVCRPDETARAYGAVIELLRAAIGPAPAASGWLAELRSDVVREVGRLLPEVADVAGPPLPVDGQGATARLTAALATALAAAASAGPQPPGVLVIDDVQWSDPSSLDVLWHLARDLTGQPVCVLLAWPTELVGRGHPLRRLVSELAGRQLVRQLPLGRLNATAVRILFDDVAGADRPDAGALTDQIIDMTEGIPLLVVECLMALDRDPAALADAHQGVDDLLLGRLEAIGPVARQMLTAAAVLGRPFDVELIRDASGRTGDETVDALAELTAAGLLTAPGHGRAGYDIAHTRLRTLAVERAGHVRRRLLHRRVAAALEHREPHGAQSLTAVVAAHHAAGGDEPAAAAWFARAAAHAAQLLAVPEAADLYERALVHGHPEPAGIHDALGDLQMLTGRCCHALRSYDAAAALVDDERFAVLEHKIAGVYQRWGRWTLADEHLCTALATLEGDEAPSVGALRARILTDRGLVALRRNHTDEARSLARAALEEAQQANARGAQAGAHNLLGVVRKDDLPAARDHLERALDLARRHHDVGVEVAAANNLAQAHAAAGALDLALPLAESALARVGQLADHHREAALRNNLADLLRAAGRHEEAMLHLKRAVALFAEIGEPDERAPEIWPLAVW